MASYLSYFTSNSSSAPPQQQYNQGQPATSTWASTFSSRINTLRKALTKDSEDDDANNEDASHVSNVLRAYYIQKSRELPQWLPPDPNKPIVTPTQQYGVYGNQYAAQNHTRGPSGGRGGLSDLWDSGPSQSAPQKVMSLRSPRPGPQSLRAMDGGQRPGAVDPYSSQGPAPNAGARPLPSQRAGSHQNIPVASAPSKADRLRARLQGGGGSGRSSPALSPANPVGFSESDQYAGTGGGGGGGGGGGASNPYQYSGDPYAVGAPDTGRNSPYRPRPGGPR